MRHRLNPAFLLLAAASVAFAGPAAAQGTAYVNWESPQSHPVDLSSDGLVLVAVNTADNRLEVFDVQGGALSHRGAVPVGLDPVSVRLDASHTAWVVNQISDSVSVVDLATMRVVRTVLVGDEPADLVLAGNPRRAFVTLARPGALAVFDAAATSPAIQAIALQAASPRALAASPDGSRVYAAVFESGNYSTVVSRAQVSSPTGPYNGVNPPPNDGNAFFPAIAPGLPAPPRVSQVVRKGSDGTWRDDNNRNWSQFVTWDLHDHDVAVVDTATLGVTYVSGLMTTVTGLAISDTGSVMAVGTEATNEVRFEPNLNGTFIRAKAATFAPGAATAPAVDLNPHLDYSTPTVSVMARLQSLGDPRGVSWLPGSEDALVVGMGSNSLAWVSADGGRVATIGVGQGPTGLAVSADGSRAFVLNRFEATVSVVDLAARREVARHMFHDPTPATVRAGRPFLYDTHLTSGLGQASCASCHVDGRSDRLAWDLGDPQGGVLAFDEDCQAPAGGCVSWHPMKGPMTTQSLMGIIGNEPFHWRGEKANLAEFNVAYTNLQGRESQLTPAEMEQLTAYVASLTYPPNPNRAMNGGLRTSLAVANGTGNPVNGQTVFATAPTLPGPPGGAPLTCLACHPGPIGTNGNVDIPVGGEPQNRKNAQLRDVYRKVGANRASQQGNRGFGFDHHGEEFTIQDVLSIGFQFPPGATGQQQRRDVEAFLLSFGTDTHAGIGSQVTMSHGGGVGDDATRLNEMMAVAATGQVALVAKGRVAGESRGWVLRAGVMVSDRETELLTPGELLVLAAPGSELTYTLVPANSAVRIGVDRDADGYLDRDELDAGTDPASAASTPRDRCPADIAPTGGDGTVDGADLGLLLSRWGMPGLGDLDGSGAVNGADLGTLLSSWGPCAAK
jgi:YVTN family beta-propeller protein